MNETHKDFIKRLMSYAGYDFIEENPETRLLFYDSENENEIQLWITDGDNTQRCIKLIANKALEIGIARGKFIIQNSIKKALGL